MKLKATKTSMYKLAARYIPDLPPMRQMIFDKTPRTRSWWLEGIGHKVYLGEGWGHGSLADNGNCIALIPVDDLRDLGMIQEDTV